MFIHCLVHHTVWFQATARQAEYHTLGPWKWIQPITNTNTDTAEVRNEYIMTSQQSFMLPIGASQARSVLESVEEETPVSQPLSIHNTIMFINTEATF